VGASVGFTVREIHERTGEHDFLIVPRAVAEKKLAVGIDDRYSLL
jgi:hypothetical protein